MGGGLLAGVVGIGLGLRRRSPSEHRLISAIPRGAFTVDGDAAHLEGGGAASMTWTRLPQPSLSARTRIHAAHSHRVRRRN
ncbi:hypothetical protein NKG05_11845 [Oerskovia sp. M15]